MGSNTSLLARCGDPRPQLVAIDPDDSAPPPRFALVGSQLALVVSPASAGTAIGGYRFHITARSDTDVPLKCTAHVTADSRRFTELPMTHSRATSREEPGLVTATVDLKPLLTASPGLYNVRACLDDDTVFSIPVSVDPATARSTTSTPPVLHSPSPPQSALHTSTSRSPKFYFPPDGPQFRTLLADRETAVPQLRLELRSCLDKSTRLCDLLSTTSKELAGLVSSLQELNSFSSVLSPPFYDTLFALQKALNGQSQTHAQLASIIHNYFNSPIYTYLASLDLKSLSSRRKLYHDQAKLFYSYMGKNLSTADSANLAKKIQFELQRFDFFIYLTGLLNGPAVRKLVRDWAQFPSKLDPTSSTTAPLLQQAAQFQEDYKSYKVQWTAQREKISRSRSFSDFAPQHTSQTHKVHKEGILWTYKGHGKTSGWHKQWVVLKDSTLSEYSDWKTEGKKLSHPPLNLTFACIRRNDGRKYNGFEIITTSGVTRSFRAESKSDLDQWIQVLQVAIGIDVHTPESEEPSNPSTPWDIVINADASNTTCCDCGDSNQVEWISINLLCVLCIQCSAVHRSLGSHISKVRSLLLDSFTSREIKELLKYVSNKNLNSIYEAELTQKSIIPGSSVADRTRFITDKYVSKKYVSPLQEDEPDAIQKRLNHNLIKSIHLNSIYLLQQCIAQGANLNQVHLEHGETVFQYSLQHYAGTKTDPIFFITEFLLLSGLQVGRLPRDTTSLSKSEYSYWKSKAETNGVYSTQPIMRSATTKEKSRNIAKIDTNISSNPSTRNSLSASEVFEKNSKRWSVGGTGSLSSPVSASLANHKTLNLKFPKLHGGKST